MNILNWIINGILIQNIVLNKFLGTCPFLGVSKNKKSSLGMGLAVVLVIFISSLVTWFVYKYLLIEYDLIYMKTIIYILLIASLVQIIEMFIRKKVPNLYNNLGIYLPLITTNCAVLGVCNIISNYSFLHALIFSLSSGVGFLLVLLIFSSIREKIEQNNIANSFSGLPISLIIAGIMSLILSRFSGV